MEEKLTQILEALDNLKKATQREKLIDLKQVIDDVGMTKSTIYRYMSKGDFPKPIKADPDNPNSASRWKDSEIQDYINSRPVMSVEELQ